MDGSSGPLGHQRIVDHADAARRRRPSRVNGLRLSNEPSANRRMRPPFGASGLTQSKCVKPAGYFGSPISDRAWCACGGCGLPRRRRRAQVRLRGALRPAKRRRSKAAGPKERRGRRDAEAPGVFPYSVTDRRRRAAPARPEGPHGSRAPCETYKTCNAASVAKSAPHWAS